MPVHLILMEPILQNKHRHRNFLSFPAPTLFKLNVFLKKTFEVVRLCGESGLFACPIRDLLPRQFSGPSYLVERPRILRRNPVQIHSALSVTAVDYHKWAPELILADNYPDFCLFLS